MQLCTRQTSILIWILHIALSDSFIVCVYVCVVRSTIFFSSFFGGFYVSFLSVTHYAVVMVYILTSKYTKFFQLSGCCQLCGAYIYIHSHCEHTMKLFCIHFFRDAWMLSFFFLENANNSVTMNACKEKFYGWERQDCWLKYEHEWTTMKTAGEKKLNVSAGSFI